MGSSAKNATVRDSIVGTIQIVIGYILAIFFGITVAIGGPTSGLKTATDIIIVMISLALTVWGVMLIVRGTKRRKMIILFREYAARLATDPFHSIDQLAAAKGIPVETAKKNILDMIRRGYFLNAHIDFDRNYLVFAHESASSDSGSFPQPGIISPFEFVSVSCHGCGAVNKIQKGTLGACDFCGNPLSGT